MQAKRLSLSDIAVGDTAEFTREWKEEDVDAFATLSGDANPLHTNSEYAATTMFGQRVVHGMLTASLCSQLVGMHLPGEKCLYLEQTLSFRKPVFINDVLTVKGTVIAKSEVTRILTIEISITKKGEEVLSGTARVQVM